MGLLTILPKTIASLGKLTSKQTEGVFYTYLYGFLYGYSIKNIQFIAKQIILETGWGGSELLNKNNNLFGMSCTNSLNSFQSGCSLLSDGNTNAKYKTLKQSVKDRYTWDRERFNTPYELRQTTEYPEAVSSRYFPQSPISYLENVSNIHFNFFPIFLIFITIIPLELFLLFKIIK